MHTVYTPTVADNGAHRSTWPHASARLRHRRRLTSEKLVNDEVTGGSVTTDVFPNSIRIYRYPWLAQRLTRTSSTVAMVARWWCTVVLRPSPAMAWLGEHSYGIYKP